MAPCSSILAWKILAWTEELGGCSTGLGEGLNKQKR